MISPGGQPAYTARVDDLLLRQAFALGQKAWPKIELEFPVFRAHCQRVLGEVPEWDWMRYSAELSSEEIGDVLGISRNAARTRLSRALGRLAADLRD